jgi:hypothetical protein
VVLKDEQPTGCLFAGGAAGDSSSTMRPFGFFRFQVSDVRLQASGRRGKRFVPSAWFLVLGSWFLVLGAKGFHRLAANSYGGRWSEEVRAW